MCLCFTCVASIIIAIIMYNYTIMDNSRHHKTDSSSFKPSLMSTPEKGAAREHSKSRGMEWLYKLLYTFLQNII